MGVDQFVRCASKQSVRVRSPQLSRLTELIAAPDVTIESVEPAVAEITGLDSEQIGETASANSIVLYELTPLQASLEEAFMELTRDEVEFHGDGRAATTERQGTGT